MRKAALLVVTLVFALAGCTTIADMRQLRQDLEAEGYDVGNINHDTTNGHAVLRLGATTTATDDDGSRVAEIAWTKFPADIDSLVVTLNGEQVLDLDADELTDRFGERPESLGDAVDSGPNVTVIVVSVVAALLLAGLVVLVWLRGRRPPPTAPPGPPHHPAPYPAPPHPPQYPG